MNATFIHGADYIRQDPSGKHLRLDVHSTLKDKDNGSLIKMSYTGIIELNQGIVAALTGAPEAKTTQFGDICKSYHCLTLEIHEQRLLTVNSHSCRV